MNVESIVFLVWQRHGGNGAECTGGLRAKAGDGQNHGSIGRNRMHSHGWPTVTSVLLVADDAPLREATSLALKRYGYEVHTAVDGIDGWARFRGPSAPTSRSWTPYCRASTT